MLQYCLYSLHECEVDRTAAKVGSDYSTLDLTTSMMLSPIFSGGGRNKNVRLNVLSWNKTQSLKCSLNVSRFTF